MRTEFMLTDWYDWTSFSEERRLVVDNGKVFVEDVPYKQVRTWKEEWQWQKEKEACRLEKIVKKVMSALESVEIEKNLRANVKGLIGLIDSHNVNVDKQRAWWLVGLLEVIGIIRFEKIESERAFLEALLIEEN